MAIAAAVALLCLIAPHDARSAAFGYSTTGSSDAFGVSETVGECDVTQVPCPTTPTDHLSVVAPFDGTYWSVFQTDDLSGGTMRFWAPYDMLYSYNTSTGRCGPSPFEQSYAGLALYDALVWNIQAAERLGLTPEVQFVGGSGEGGVPFYPEPGYATSGGPWNGWTVGGLDYYCGTYEIMSALHAQVPGVHLFESMNEPDALGWYNTALTNPCNTGQTPNACGAVSGYAYDSPSDTQLCNDDNGTCGPTEAAELWYLANAAANAEANADGGPANEVAAGPLGIAANATSPFYLAYQSAVLNMGNCAPSYPCGTTPTYWAIHDYEDPTVNGTADLASFENALSINGLTAQHPINVWVTETGLWLYDGDYRDQNYPFEIPSGTCANQLFDCLVNGNGENQYAFASDWRSLGSVSAPGVTTQYVDWFEFTAIGSWDSALLDHNGVPRPSYCALTGLAQAECPGSTAGYMNPPAPSPSALSPGRAGAASPASGATPVGPVGSSMINGTVSATALSRAAAAHSLPRLPKTVLPPSLPVRIQRPSGSRTRR